MEKTASTSHFAPITGCY